MTFDRTDRTGFAPPRSVRTRARRCTAVAQLITSGALVLSIAIAATTVSIGIARADGARVVAENSSVRVCPTF